MSVGSIPEGVSCAIAAGAMAAGATTESMNGSNKHVTRVLKPLATFVRDAPFAASIGVRTGTYPSIPRRSVVPYRVLGGVYQAPHQGTLHEWSSSGRWPILRLRV